MILLELSYIHGQLALDAHHLLLPNNSLASLVVITRDLNGRSRPYPEVNYIMTR